MSIKPGGAVRRKQQIKNTANFPFAEKAKLGMTLLGEDGVTIISSFFIYKTFLVFKYSYINKSRNKKNPRNCGGVFLQNFTSFSKFQVKC